MKFSLIVPVAIRTNDIQRAKFLVECLESILVQTHTDYEVILKDAFPKDPVKNHDNVRTTMQKFGSKLNYIAMADKNVTDGINQALWWATGDIFHIVNGDDLTSPSDSLEFVAAQFAGHPEPAWMYGSLGTVLEDGSEGHWGVTPFATLEEMLIHNRCGTPATYWNRAMFKQLGYQEYVLASDYDYWCRCYRVTPPMYTTRLIGTGRRWNQSISHINCEFVEQEASTIAAKHSAAYARGESPRYVPWP